MIALDKIIAAARLASACIVLPEATDSRILIGAARALRERVARVILLGARSKIEPLWRQYVGDMPFDCIDPSASPNFELYAKDFLALRCHKGMDERTARAEMLQPLNFAAMMVRQGHADGTVAGAVTTSADTVRAALQIIGPSQTCRLVSSFFLMMLCEPHHAVRGAFLFADCGLVIDPTAEELAHIAIASAQSYTALTGQEPKVAMLSFSTADSAQHEKESKVVEAVRLALAAHPDLLVDGDVQFDAAFVETVAALKAPDSTLRGNANVFIFPNLDAANIGYKIAQRIGGAKAIGPILQGLAHPANDLSRGCSAEDVFHMIALTALQARPSQQPLAG